MNLLLTAFWCYDISLEEAHFKVMLVKYLFFKYLFVKVKKPGKVFEEISLGYFYSGILVKVVICIFYLNFSHYFILRGLFGKKSNLCFRC